MSYPNLDSPNLSPELEHPGQCARPVIFGGVNFTDGFITDENEVNGLQYVCQILAMVEVGLIHHI